ncbi:hypothetical protein AURANDRAFT_67431 [Aureococcus anophagefferens]|uniref:Uncharacterized protein n=1 Tax=Aureococcus anophagefferens TaxID=44056 RepID=F0YL38_AURAN|nr:hypothetical protein AURANDRAFT_67431 [Aureococcus anophagefferens]EGB04181.1 hypothetical protein AURANDRAFT_67431 [Aureococcus anophagefferens]|eukprot:XP_009041166.1 hypothetical protein AURANDRAFT_67431 [Aureococcus anophagefferens]
MAAFVVAQLRKYGELRNDLSSFEGRTRTDNTLATARRLRQASLGAGMRRARLPRPPKAVFELVQRQGSFVVTPASPCPGTVCMWRGRAAARGNPTAAASRPPRKLKARQSGYRWSRRL